MKNLISYDEWLLNEGQMKHARRWGDKKHEDFHEAKFELLKEVADSLGSSKWWIDYGTLLGAVREGDFIKADNDVDCGILAKSVTPDLIDKLKSNDKLEVNISSSDYDSWFKANMSLKDEEGKLVKVNGMGITCDLYVYYPCEDYYVMRDPMGSDRFVYYRVEKDHVENLGSISIRRTKFPAPSNPKTYLSNIYGEDWETPNKGKTSHDNSYSKYMNKLKSYKYDRKNNKGIVEYTKAHLEEKEKKNEENKSK